LLKQIILHSVLGCFALFLWCKSISSSTQCISSDVAGTWIGEEQIPETNANQNFQHSAASCSAMIHRIVESASAVYSRMEG